MSLALTTPSPAGTAAPRPRVLCVDDDEAVLAALSNALRRRFDVVTADSAAAALRTIADHGPFAVVVSDFAMPGMNGIDLLARVRSAAPETTRVLLTGHATLQAAIHAVNDGHVFRFLTKPCGTDDVLRTLDDAVEHTRLVTADRELVHRKLDAMAAQLVRAERLASLGTMAGAVGHELANLLSVMDSAVAMVAEDAAAGRPATQADLQMLRQVQSHLANHAHNLLHLGRPAAASAAREPTDLGRGVGDMLAMLRSAGLFGTVKLQLDLPTDTVLVDLSRHELEQVVVNLTKNAVDAFGDQRNGRRMVRVCVDATPTHGVFSVVDTAGGIAPATLPLIFEPYYTTKAPDRGTGLGLFVVKRIVEASGGTVAVSSELGAGTTFTLELPRA